MARPSKLTAEVGEQIRQAILAGAPLRVAASHGRIHEATLHRYQARGLAALEAADWTIDDVPAADRPYCEFYETVEAARRQWELGQLAVIQRAAQGQAAVGADGRPAPVIETETRTTYDAAGNMTGSVVIERRGLKPDWRAALTVLERRIPQEYGKTLRAEVTGPEGAPIEMRVEDLVARGEAAIDELRARRDRKKAS